MCLLNFAKVSSMCNQRNSEQERTNNKVKEEAEVEARCNRPKLEGQSDKVSRAWVDYSIKVSQVQALVAPAAAHSHSMVPGGLLVTS